MGAIITSSFEVSLKLAFIKDQFVSKGPFFVQYLRGGFIVSFLLFFMKKKVWKTKL